MKNQTIPSTPRLTKKQKNLVAAKTSLTKAAASSLGLVQGPTLPDQDELQRRFDEATARRIPHYFWPLPRWTTVKPTLEDNVTDPPTFTRPTKLKPVFLLRDRINALREKFPGKLTNVLEQSREVEAGPDADVGEPITQAPHPNSSFAHVDPGVYHDPDVVRFRNAIRGVDELRGLAKLDGEMAANFSRAIPPLLNADALLQPNPRGMQRLKLVFEWTLCQVTTVFGEINAALDNPNAVQGKSDYNAALDKYLELLRDLDDHEPETRGQPTPGERGYGRAVKWAYILPIIYEGRIKGSKVVAKWNPHISSSGIPIPHS